MHIFCMEERWALCCKDIEIASDGAPGFFWEVLDCFLDLNQLLFFLFFWVYNLCEKGPNKVEGGMNN